jgi:hypothetical protein
VMESGPETNSAEGAAPAKRGSRAALHVVGFIVGIGLLAWCVVSALKPENREHLAALRDADRGLLAALVGLSLASLVVNGVFFWVVIRPARGVPLWSVLGVNAMATALASLPFKLSVVCRFVVHHRRDGVPVMTIMLWMGNALALILAALAPLVLVSLWRGRVDAVWLAVAGAGVAVSSVLVIAMARFVSREGVWRWLEAKFGAGSGKQGWARRMVARFDLLLKAREGMGMLTHPTAVFGGVGLRCADIAIQAARFVIAAKILGEVLAPDEALLAASLYFVVGLLSPTGSLGFREAAVVGTHAVSSGAAGTGGASVIVLTVTAADTLVVVTAALIAAAGLRVDRLMVRGTR